MSFRQTFATRLRAQEELVGTFVKSRDPAVVEILGALGFDFFVLDAEHAPFDRADIGLMALASRAAALPMIVRIPEPSGLWIGTVVDCGAAGVMVPQVRDAAMADRLSKSMRFGPEGLGFSPSTAGAGYGGRSVNNHLERRPQETVLICQIEDPVAVENAGAIAGTSGVDALLIGPVDLAVSIGASSPSEQKVTDLCRQTIAAGREAKTSSGLFLGKPEDAPVWRDAGATLFILGTDQAFLRRAAGDTLAAFRKG